MQPPVLELPLLIAGGLTALTTVVHVWVGGPETARALLRAADLAEVARYTAYYCWHVVTITLIAMTFGFLWPGFGMADPSAATPSALIAAAFALWSAALVIWKRRPPLELPQWAAFAAIAVSGFWGAGSWGA